MFRVPYRWLPRTFYGNIKWIISDIVDGVKNVIRWTPIIWYDADFDWMYLAQIMEYKLRRMANYEEIYGHHLTSLRDAKNQKICANLLKRLNADEYYKNAKIRFRDDLQAARHCEVVQRNDQKYLGMLLGKYLNTWWD